MNRLLYIFFGHLLTRSSRRFARRQRQLREVRIRYEKASDASEKEFWNNEHQRLWKEAKEELSR